MNSSIHTYYVYILSNKNRNVYYTGVTNNLTRRVIEHKNKHIKGFTSKYNVDELIYYEVFIDIREAIAREKQIKKYSRAKKLYLIESKNPGFKTLM